MTSKRKAWDFIHAGLNWKRIIALFAWPCFNFVQAGLSSFSFLPCKENFWVWLRNISPSCLVKSICERGSHKITLVSLRCHRHSQLARHNTTVSKGQVKGSDFHSLHRVRLQSWRMFGIKQIWSWLNAQITHHCGTYIKPQACQRLHVPLHLLENIW